jgi:putative molybdopterin biosynthesis protein
MHRVHLTYTLQAQHATQRDLHHPLMALLAAVHDSGSISGAARRLSLSYRHVWGELKRWELQFGQTLVSWIKGQPAVLSPFGEKLLWAERRAQARLAPQVEALRSELERAFAIAFDDSAGVIPIAASHDDALPLLRQRAQSEHKLHLDIQFTGSVEALQALNDGRCLLAGFHALTESAPRSISARTYRPLLKPGRHKLVSFALRTQGLMTAAGNPLALQGLADLRRPGLRIAQRERGTGTRVLLDELLAAQHIDLEPASALCHIEPSHRAAAEAVASGSADVAFGIEAAARARGLGFVPLVREQYFLAALAPSLEHPHVRSLLDLLRGPAWQAQIDALPGYSAERGGEVLSLRRVLPWWSYRKPKPRPA